MYIFHPRCRYCYLLLLILTLLAAACESEVTSLPTAVPMPAPSETSITQPSPFPTPPLPPALFLPWVQRAHATVSPTPAAAAIAPPHNTRIYLPLTFVAPAPAVFNPSNCTIYQNIRITWYELGTCCGKAPGHPQYGITRSGWQVAWGMAAVQAQRPLIPIGTHFIVADIGPQYQFTVTDTGSETAFGSSWIDLYVPTITIGRWVEHQVGLDGRSNVYVCRSA